MNMGKIVFSNAHVQNVFSQYDYDDFSRLMFDAGLNRLDGIEPKVANAKIREVMFSVLGVDENSSKKEVRKALRRHKVDVYEVIEETVERLLAVGWGQNPFFERFVEIRNLADGDSAEFLVDDASILVVSKVSGNHHDIIRQKYNAPTRITIPMDWYAVKIYAEFESFLIGNIDWAKFITKIYEAFDRKVGDIIYSALVGSGAQMPNTDYNKTGTLVKENVIQLAQRVEASTGEKTVIMGTKAALSALTALCNASWISDNMKETRNTFGSLRVWEGFELVEIPQRISAEDQSKMLVSDKMLLFIGGDNQFIKLANGGEGRVHEVSDGGTNLDATIEYEYQHKVGVGLVFNKNFGMWTMP